MSLAEERKQMMLAHGEELNVLHNHHLVIVNVEERIVENVRDIHRVTACKELHGLLHAFRCAHQPIARGVFADAYEQFAIEILRRDAIQQGSFKGSRRAWHKRAFLRSSPALVLLRRRSQRNYCWSPRHGPAPGEQRESSGRSGISPY